MRRLEKPQEQTQSILGHPKVWESDTKKPDLCAGPEEPSNLLLEASTIVCSLIGWSQPRGSLELSVQNLEMCL